MTLITTEREWTLTQRAAITLWHSVGLSMPTSSIAVFEKAIQQAWDVFQTRVPAYGSVQTVIRHPSEMVLRGNLRATTPINGAEAYIYNMLVPILLMEGPNIGKVHQISIFDLEFALRNKGARHSLYKGIGILSAARSKDW
jgi:hypothetical protein